VRRPVLVAGAALGLGCRPPPPAPEDLDALAAFLYAEHLNPDPDVLAEGLVNLQVWFASAAAADADRGFELAVPLSVEAVAELDASAAWQHPEASASRAWEGMGGAAAGTTGAFAVEQYVHALVAVDQDLVFPDTFEAWSRTWRLCDGDTFDARDCEQLESDEQQSSAFGLGLRTVGEAYNQYRWIELPDGQLAMTHRNWQLYPPEASSALLEVVDQYYLNTFVPAADGAAVHRLQATWAVFGERVPEDLALSLTAGSMVDSSETLEAWLEAQAQ
jgi:hypothetical protein